MSARHLLKTHPEHFWDVTMGRKTVELRKNDRGFQVGDTLDLREWDPGTEQFTGKAQLCFVTHFLPGGQFGLASDYCALSVRLINE